MSASENPGRRRPTRPRRAATAQRTSPAFGTTWRRAHLTVDEREARGQQGRKDAPRRSHADWRPASDRPDPIALLEEQAATRVPELVPIRYGRMLVSPFSFFRGAALIMAADLAATPAFGRHGPAVRRCPPLELRPVRIRRAQAALRRQRLRRDAAGPVGVGRQAPGRELRCARARPRVLGEATGVRVVLAGVRAYREHMRHAAEMRTLDSWYEHLDANRLLERVRAETRRGRLSKREAPHRPGADREGAHARQRARVRQAGRRGGRRAAHRRRPAADRPDRRPDRVRHRVGRRRDAHQEAARCRTGARSGTTTTRSRSSATCTLPARSSASAASARAATSCCCSAATISDPLVPAGEGGPDLGARAVPGQERVPAPRRAHRRRPARDAGGERHLPRLAAHQGPRRRQPRLLRAPVPRLEGRDRRGGARGHAGRRSMPRSAARPSPARTRAGATASPSRRTWGRGTCSTAPSPTFAAAYGDQNDRDYATFVDAVGSGRLVAEPGL